jgi:hypothetical protein
MCIPNQNYLIDALDIVLGWNISDELLLLALANQAQLMAGFDCEEPYHDVDDGWPLSPESYVAFQ